MSSINTFSSLDITPKIEISNFTKYVSQYYSSSERNSKKLDMTLNRKVCELLYLTLDPDSSEDLIIFAFFLKKYGVMPLARIYKNKFSKAAIINARNSGGFIYNFSRKEEDRNEIFGEISPYEYDILYKQDLNNKLEDSLFRYIYSNNVSHWGQNKGWPKLEDYYLWRYEFSIPFLFEDRNEKNRRVILTRDHKINLGYTYQLLKNDMEGVTILNSFF